MDDDNGPMVFAAILVVVSLVAGAVVLVLVLKPSQPTPAAPTPSVAAAAAVLPPAPAVLPPATETVQVQQAVTAGAKQPMPLVAKDPFVPGKRKALKYSYETPEFVLYWDIGYLTYTAAEALEVAKKMAVMAEQAWKEFTRHGFALNPTALKFSGQDRYKKPIFMGGACTGGAVQCGFPGGGNFLSKEGDISFITAGDIGTLPHELAHLRQVSSGGFTSGSNVGWAWESCACYMHEWVSTPVSYYNPPIAMGVDKLWYERHALSLELHDGILSASSGYPYSSWPFWLWIDKTFGFGTVGRMWSESKPAENVPECLSRLVKKPVADLFGDWIAATLQFSYFNDPKGEPRYIEFSKLLKETFKSNWWTYFDTADVRGSTVTVTSAHALQPFGFHAVKLDRLGGKRLRLDTTIDPPSWRMVVISDGKQAEILAAGVTSAPLGPSGGIVGIISTTRSTKTLPQNAYSITLS